MTYNIIHLGYQMTFKIQHFIQQFNGMMNKTDDVIIEEIFAPHFKAHVPFMPQLSLSSYRAYLQSFRDTFPDLCQEINDSFINDNRLVLRITYSGTHRRDFLGIPATLRTVTISGICIFQIDDGLIVENWTELDVFGAIWQMSNEVFTSSLS
jgi:steroid delta-isomerase-like uncharacterized protein